MNDPKLVAPKHCAWLASLWGIALIFPGMTYADPASAPNAAPPIPGDCEPLLKRAENSVAAMPKGVEKSAAQEELSAARAELSQGQITNCKIHVKNAMTAVKSK